MKMNKFLALGAIAGSLFFSSCSSDDDNINIENPATYENGVYVLNEGNFGDSNSSVSFIKQDFSGSSNNIFSEVNNEPLGDVGQSMDIYEDYALIVVNGSNILHIVNKNTFELVNTIEEDLYNPRYVTAYNGKAYVTNAADFLTGEDDYIAVIDLETFEVEKKVIAGTKLEKIEEDNGVIYIEGASFSDGNTIHVFDPSSNEIARKITTAQGLNSFAVENNTVFTLSTSEIQQFNLESGEEMWSIELNENFKGSSQSLELENDHLYFTSGKSIYSISEDSEELPESPVFTYDSTSDQSGGIAINIHTSYIYVGYTPSYTENGTVGIYNLNGELVKEFQVGVAPKSFYFNN